MRWFCHLGQQSQSGRNRPHTARKRQTPSAATGRSSPQVRVLGVAGWGWRAGEKGEGGGRREKRTYLVQAQVSVVSPGAVPRPLARCSAVPGAASARDLGCLGRFLRETTVNPHYCSSCRSGPRIALLRLAAAVLSASVRRGQEPNLFIFTVPADDSWQESACVRERMFVPECGYVCVCEKRECVRV